MWTGFRVGQTDWVCFGVFVLLVARVGPLFEGVTIANSCREVCDLLDKGSLGSLFDECALVGEGALLCLDGEVGWDTGGYVLC